MKLAISIQGEKKTTTCRFIKVLARSIDLFAILIFFPQRGRR